MGVRRGWALGAAALALGAAVTGCSAGGGEANVNVQGTWVLASGRTSAGALELGDMRVTLSFDGTGAGGKAPCNDYGSQYDVDGTGFELTGDGVSRTLMGCGAEAEALERAYLDAFSSVDTVRRDGDTLTLSGDGTELVLTSTPPWPRTQVVGHTWRLVSYTDTSGTTRRPRWEPGKRPFLRLDESGPNGGRITASNGCSTMTGRWREWRGAPTITRSGWAGSCGASPTDQEVAIGNALGEPVLELRGAGSRQELVLRYAHGTDPATLVYRR